MPLKKLYVCIMDVAGPAHTVINPLYHTVNGILHALTVHIQELLNWALETIDVLHLLEIH
jgi:hypothetical protein